MESMKLNYDQYKVVEDMVENFAEDKIPMIVCHPGYLDQYILNTSSLTIPRTQEVKMDPKIAELIRYMFTCLYSECK